MDSETLEYVVPWVARAKAHKQAVKRKAVNSMGVCKTCGADLTTRGSVRYVERYDAYIDGNSVVYAPRTIDISAACVQCGALVEYYIMVP